MENAKLIEAGWKSYRRACIPHGASARQVTEARQAYYAGAAILFQTIMHVLEPGDEPTPDDLQRMSHVSEELDEFGAELDARFFGGVKH